jgi:hypothetical protein
MFAITIIGGDELMNASNFMFMENLERVVMNYKAMGVLNEKESAIIIRVADSVLPKPTLKGDGKVIYFPGAWQEQKPVEPPKPPEPPKTPSYSDVRDFLKEQGVSFRGDLAFVLYKLGGYDLQTIAAISARELKKYQGVGEKSIATLRAFLQSKGFDLKGRLLSNR